MVGRFEKFLQDETLFEGREELSPETSRFTRVKKELRTFWQKRRVKLGSADQEKLATLARLGDFIEDHE